MNRVIKFRAWDIENKKMIYDFANFSSGNIIDVPEGRWSHELRLTNKNEIKASLNFKSNDAFETKRIEYIPTMQYTGLEDKNGVEIYEGDIIEELWLSPVSGEKYPLRMAVFRDITGAWRVKYPNGTLGNVHLLRKRIEVIGSIYENSELLEVES